MLLDDLTVTVLSIQFFVETARIISMSYTNGCGLFVRDKIRPVIESAINLIVSIAMTNVFGIAGVFIGTIISHLCTVFWREPYLLHKYEFKKSMKEYWICYGLSAFIAAFLCILFSLLFTLLPSVHNLGEWILKALRPQYIKAMSTSLAAVPSVGVTPSVNPTVAIAEPASKRLVSTGSPSA